MCSACKQQLKMRSKTSPEEQDRGLQTLSNVRYLPV
jgi:hypothetical protein